MCVCGAPAVPTVVDCKQGCLSPDQYCCTGNSAHRLGLLSGSSGLMRLVLQTVIQRAIRDPPLMEAMIQAVIALYGEATLLLNVLL